MRNDGKDCIPNAWLRFAALAISALPLASWAIDIRPPAGWRSPESADLTDTWRAGDPLRYAVALGDFDGNGVEDEARLLISERSNRSGLFIFLRQVNGSYRIHRLDRGADRSLIPAMGIRKLPAGSYPTAFGKGYFDCGAKQSKEIALPHSAIEYFKFESYSIYYYWHPRKKKFSRAWISD